ncbi:MAG: DNA photolyase family protein [Granulosicoccus sp.]|nr:DNA photolyase family protein [Granulosicoccus sp.]
MNQFTLVWCHRDFRLADHPALRSALAESQKVLFVYIHDPQAEGRWQAGAASNWWLHHSLLSFSASLRSIGTELIIRRGDSLTTLFDLCKETGADAVYWNRLYEPALIARDKIVKSQLQSDGVNAKSFNGALLREPWHVSKDDGTMYRVYTPFSRKYFQLPEPEIPLDAPEQIPTGHNGIKTESVESLSLLPDIPWDTGFSPEWTPGETGAAVQLDTFIDHGVLEYGEARDWPATDGVSKLSPHLHFGEISPRQIWHAIRFHGEHASSAGVENAAERVQPYLKQLIWRDFAHHILFHLPETTDQPFNPKFSTFRWEDNERVLKAWQRGKTGIPLVDAGMRQLWQTGWMHNRIRMLVASVLTKNGLVHWLEGARWFWDTLVDASLANNSMGWQWTAGCGVDAAPYYRIFSPARQGERFDKDGAYVRRWVPELAGVPAKYIHEPWLATPDILSSAGVTLGKEYPKPMVDLSLTRKEALERYKQIKTLQ